MYKVLLILVFVLFQFICNAEGRIRITPQNEGSSFNLDGKIFYIVDDNDSFSFIDILNENENLTQAKEPLFYYEAGHPSQWYKFSVNNETNKNQILYFSIDNPLVNEITFFSSLDSSYRNLGLIYPFDQREVKHKNFIFKINLQPQQEGVFCLHIASQISPNDISFSLSASQKFIERTRIGYYASGLFNAFLIILVVLLIVLWRTENEKVYLFFLLFIVSLLVVRFWRSEILFQFIWPNSPSFNVFIGRMLYPLVLVNLLLFVNQLFFVVKSKRSLRLLFKYSVLYLVVFTVVQSLFFKLQYWYFGLQIGTLLSIVVTVMALVKSFQKKQRYFGYYLFSFTVFILILIATIFFRFDIRGIGYYDNQLNDIALLAFVGVIAYIFLSKYISTKGEIVSMNKNLEQLVQKRTFQLNAQKEELRSQQEELIQQKETLQAQREELRAQKELLELKNVELGKLSLVASKTDNLIYIFTPEGVLDWFNSSFGISFGMTLDEYRRGEEMNIIDVSTNKNVRHVLNTCLREKAVVSYESKHFKENGDFLWYHTTLTPILDERDEIKHLIAIDTDITRLKIFEEELSEQKHSADVQKNLAVQRKEELESRQLEITDSIRYAKRIQTAIMPRVKQIQRDFVDSFILFLPKDIVSGDFYWYHRIGDKYYIAAVDCTGHGVPGAFMSIIGNYLLNSIIIQNGVSDPAEILKQLNRKIKIALKSDNRSQNSDGMDIALAVIDKKNRTLEFASALRTMFLFSDGRFAEIKGDKIPITSSISGTAISNFTTHSFDFNPGDFFYMFSDGIIDQFGGSRGKKFLTKRFKQLLFEINPLSMREQKEIIKKAFDDWKGEYEQVDDVLVMGVRYKEQE